MSDYLVPIDVEVLRKKVKALEDIVVVILEHHPEIALKSLAEGLKSDG